MKCNFVNHVIAHNLLNLDFKNWDKFIKEKALTSLTVKNTLLRKAMEKSGLDYSEIFPALNGSTSIMLSNVNNLPAKLIKEFRATSPKPLLKAAYVEESFYLGDANLDVLINIKSKVELIADIIAALQSPAKNVIGALQSGGGTIAGVLKTLSEKTEE
jgi:large subunit ribosomal protein L10